MTSLFKLFGAIEIISTPCIIKCPSSIEKFDKVPVDQVKSLRKRIFENKEKIPNLDYKVGRGWFYQDNFISLHQLDAFLVYYLWKSKRKN